MAQAIFSSKQATIILVILAFYLIAAILVFFSVRWRMKHSYLHNELFKSDLNTDIHKEEVSVVEQEPHNDSTKENKMIDSESSDISACDSSQNFGGEH